MCDILNIKLSSKNLLIDSASNSNIYFDRINSNSPIVLEVDLLYESDLQYIPYITSDGKYYLTIDGKYYYIKRK